MALYVSVLASQTIVANHRMEGIMKPRANVYKRDIQPSWRKEVMAWLTVSSLVVILRVTYYLITGV